jgi:hypothetical protein
MTRLVGVSWVLVPVVVAFGSLGYFRVSEVSVCVLASVDAAPPEEEEDDVGGFAAPVEGLVGGGSMGDEGGMAMVGPSCSMGGCGSSGLMGCCRGLSGD